MALTINLTDDVERRLKELAERLQVQPVTLAEIAVRDLVSASDAEFDRISATVLKKNRNLYERLR